VLLLALACGHEEPISPGTGGPTGPYQPGPPVRLTYADGYESTPTWLPDGSGILHSFDRVLNGAFDRCLGVLPAGGGSRTLEFCGASAGAPDSLDALEGAGASPGGRLMYQWSQSFSTRTSPNWSQLVLASLDRPWNDTRLTLVPYILPGGRTHARVARVDWLDDERAVYLGEDVLYPRACSNCIPDTVRIGREGVLVTVGPSGATLGIIPGTEDATSIAAAPDGAFIYLTRRMDSRVYRLPLAGGVPELVHDFGVLGPARDLALRDGRLLAVVGGFVSLVSDPTLGEWQEDRGGRLFSLDLASGEATEIPTGAPLFIRRPAPSRGDGSGGVVAEGYELVIVSNGPGLPSDTVGVSRISDLWLFEAP
jgi:hypothetical protein